MSSNNIFGKEDENFLNPNMMMGLLTLPRPLGILWSPEKIKKFLKARGYILVDRISPETEEPITVACREDDSVIPMEENLVKTFTDEVEDILLNWLLKNGREN